MAGDGDDAAVRYVDALLAPDRIPYAVLGTDATPRAGLPRVEALERVRSARFLLNVMGFVRDAELLAAARRHVYGISAWNWTTRTSDRLHDVTICVRALMAS